MRALIVAIALIVQAVVRPAPPPVVVWRAAGEGHGQPSVDGGSVYFLSRDHEVVALDASSGRERWRQHTREPGNATEGSAVVVAGEVIVAGDYNLVAFDRITGTFRWRFVPAIGYAPGIFLGGVSRGLVFAGSPAGRVYAVSAATGDLAWSTAIDDARTTVFQPVLDGADLVAGFTTRVAPNRGGVVVLDPITGGERWRTMFPLAADPLLGTGSAGNPIVFGDVVIAASGDGTVYGFDRARGSIRWSIPPIPGVPAILRGPLPVPDSPGADYRPLARTWRTLFVGSLKGPVIAYDLSTLKEQWRYDVPNSGSVSFGLVSDDRHVYVPFASGHHVALDLNTGAERWQTPNAGDGFWWTAAAVDGFVYLAGGHGGFVAIAR